MSLNRSAALMLSTLVVMSATPALAYDDEGGEGGGDDTYIPPYSCMHPDNADECRRLISEWSGKIAMTGVTLFTTFACNGSPQTRAACVAIPMTELALMWLDLPSMRDLVTAAARIQFDIQYATAQAADEAARTAVWAIGAGYSGIQGWITSWYFNVMHSIAISLSPRGPHGGVSYSYVIYLGNTLVGDGNGGTYE